MNQLTSQQLAAAHCAAPYIVCPAAAGSGKTRVLVERCSWLMKHLGNVPEEICVVTFTAAASKELQRRLFEKGCIATFDERLPMPTYRLGHCGTLHSLLFKLLREHGHLLGLPAELSILTEEESDAQLQNIAANLKVKASMKSLNEAVERTLTPIGSLGKEYVVAKEFVRQMKQSGELSYDALLALGQRLILTHPETVTFKHLLVDEAQDGCVTDWRIYNAMKCETKFFVGDERQSIYGFRGGDVKAFQRVIESLETRLMPISTNFRSSKAVVEASNRLLPHSEPANGAPDGRVSLRCFENAANEQAVITSEIASLPPQTSIAVLLRTNKAVELFKQSLTAFKTDDSNKESKTETERLALAMLKAMCAPHNDRLQLKFIELSTNKQVADAVEKQSIEVMTSIIHFMGQTDVSKISISEPKQIAVLVANFLPRKTNSNTVSINSRVMDASNHLESLAEKLPLPCSLQDLLLLAQTREPEPPRGRLHVGTIHSAKGLEWDVVYLPAFEDESWPGNKKDEDLNEEMRLAYVAITRASLECRMSWCQQRANDFQKWKIETRTPSRFALKAKG